MIIKHIEGANKIFGAPADWRDDEERCCGLPIREVHTDNGMFYVSAWEPTPEEVQQLINGETIKLWIRGPGHPVVAMSVGPLE